MKPNVYGFIPEENLIDLPFSCKLVVDPDNAYFNEQIKKDRESHLKMILVHGCEPKVVNNITNEVYFNHLSRLKYVGIEGMGRNLTIGCSIPFGILKNKSL